MADIPITRNQAADASGRALDAEPLKAVLPDYWMTAFTDELEARWSD